MIYVLDVVLLGCEIVMESVVCDIWKVLWRDMESIVCDIWKVFWRDMEGEAKVAICQRSFLLKHCSGAGGAGGPADT